MSKAEVENLLISVLLEFCFAYIATKTPIDNSQISIQRVIACKSSNIATSAQNAVLRSYSADD